MCDNACVFICVFEKERKRDFEGSFSLERRACSGQSQLDMPEKFLLEWKGNKKREKQ